MSSTGSALLALLGRDLRIAVRSSGQAIQPLLFFVLTVVLFPLAVSPEPALLRTLGPGVIWVAALLATLLSLEGLFRSDFDDGTLEQLLISRHPLPLLVLMKVFAHWLVSGLPLIVLAPVLGVSLDMSGDAIAAMVATLTLGTPVLSLLGAIGVALTVALRGGGMLLSLLVLPLYIPVLIFAAGAVSAAQAGLPIAGELALLGALLALGVALAPLASASALRISMQ